MRMKARIVCVFLLMVMLSSLFCSCFMKKSDEEMIYDRLEAFLEAYNGGDFDELIECMDRKSRSAFKSVAHLFETDTGYSLGDIFGVSVYGVSEGNLLDVVVLDLLIDEEKATVRAEMTYSDKLITASDKVKFMMVKEDDDWFVSDIKDHVLPCATLEKRMNALAKRKEIILTNGENELEKWLEKLNNVLVRHDEEELSLGAGAFYYDQNGQLYLFDFVGINDAKKAITGFELLYANGEFDIEDWRITREGNVLLFGERKLVEQLITIEFD